MPEDDARNKRCVGKIQAVHLDEKEKDAGDADDEQNPVKTAEGQERELFFLDEIIGAHERYGQLGGPARFDMHIHRLPDIGAQGNRKNEIPVQDFSAREGDFIPTPHQVKSPLRIEHINLDHIEKGIADLHVIIRAIGALQ